MVIQQQHSKFTETSTKKKKKKKICGKVFSFFFSFLDPKKYFNSDTHTTQLIKKIKRSV